jgi:2,3-bisphosphoglycerate-dependent phosphoglycerate mutase
MPVGLKLGSITDEVGSSQFLHAFFSTVSGNLEPSGWGTRFPVLLNKLYQEGLPQADARAALDELGLIEEELRQLPPSKVIWDMAQPSLSAPWGNDISPDITHLANYFLTTTGRDLLGVLREILEELQTVGGVVQVVSY